MRERAGTDPAERIKECGAVACIDDNVGNVRTRLIDERLICEIVKKKLVVRCLKSGYLQHQDRYQLFLRINKKGGSPDSPPSEFAGFSWHCAPSPLCADREP
jgi:hypothetical protein